MKAVKEQLLAVPDHGIGFGLLRYLNSESAQALSPRPLPQVSFNYLGRLARQCRRVAWRGGRRSRNPDCAGHRRPRCPSRPSSTSTRSPSTPMTGPGCDPRGRTRRVSCNGRMWRSSRSCGCRRSPGSAPTPSSGGGGFTPSDFDLVDLRQDALEALESRCRDLTDVWPLSPLQAGMLFHAELADESVDAYLVR